VKSPIASIAKCCNAVPQPIGCSGLSPNRSKTLTDLHGQSPPCSTQGMGEPLNSASFASWTSALRRIAASLPRRAAPSSSLPHHRDARPGYCESACDDGRQ